jgi:hypothetical protein
MPETFIRVNDTDSTTDPGLTNLWIDGRYRTTYKYQSTTLSLVRYPSPLQHQNSQPESILLYNLLLHTSDFPKPLKWSASSPSPLC